MRKPSSTRAVLHASAALALLFAVMPRAAASEQIKIQAGSSMRYLANEQNPQLGQTWVAPGFNDSTWTAGRYGAGYDVMGGSNEGGAGDLIVTAVPVFTRSVFTRATFQVPDASAVLTLTLGADYDSGWAAWINGVEVFRSPELPGAGPIAWNTTAFPHESSNAPVPDYGPLLDIAATGIPALVDGTNVLAVAVWNENLISDDLVLVPQLRLDTGDPVPVCTATPEFTSALRIEATAQDDGLNQGLAGIQLAPGAVNLTLGSAVGVTVKASPVDIEQAASGTLVFTDLGGEVCDVEMRFLTDQTTLCQADAVVVSLPETIYTVGGVCDSFPFFSCTTDGECPGSCSDVCRGGFNNQNPCTDDLDCQDGFFDGFCSRRSAECSMNLPAPSEPQLPPGFEQSPECRIMTVRIPPLDPPVLGAAIELVKDGNYQSNLRVMLSVYDGALYPDFRDVTSEVESQCVVATGFSATETPGQPSTRDKGQGDIGGAPGGIPPPGVPAELPAQIKVTCANVVPVDCQTVPDPGQDFDGDGTPLCSGGVVDDCNDANPLIEPGNPEICNGFDDNCDGLLADSDFDMIEDCFDCAPFNPDAWQVPVVQATDLRLEKSGSDAILSWTSPPFSCVGGRLFEMISSLSPNFIGATCSTWFGTNAVESTVYDQSNGGEIRFLLVRPANECGDGPVAPDSSGAPRPLSCL